MNNQNPYIIVFSSGHVVDIQPMPVGDIYKHRDIIYSADDIISDGLHYDLTDRASIYSIKIPKIELLPNNPIAQSLGVTGSIDYVLRMRSGKYWNNEQYGLSTACLGKATQLMLSCGVGWPKKDYYRIVNQLIDLGRLKKAEEWKRWIDARVPDDLSVVNVTSNGTVDLLPNLEEIKNECNDLGTTLVEVGDINGCCDKCAKYRKRIYRLRGFDIRFPKFPRDFHLNCGLSICPYVYGVMGPSFNCINEIVYSNRPFVDDRNKEEIATYQNRINRIQKTQGILIREPNPARTSYYLIKKYFPELAPKSISGYMRMYNSTSKNYLKLVDCVTEKGLRLPKTVDDLYELEKSKVFENV